MPKLMLDYVYGHEESLPGHVCLIQPIGAGRLIDFTWARVLDEARRMAAHLKSRGLAPGARVAMLTKNCAHFFIAELAIWMAGGTTVAIFPTERADNIRYVLDHSEASLLFVGKLDTVMDPSHALPVGLPCISLPLATAAEFESWDSIVARTEPLAGRPARDANDLGMLLYTSGSTGRPKGVKQDFGTITRVTELRVAFSRDGGFLPAGVDQRVLSYLPLAHVYERASIECHQLLEGRGQVFFNESLATFIDDLKRARPTLFVSVPRLWLKFQQLVFQSIPEAKLDALLEDPATGKTVARQVLAGLGLDQVYSAVTGSAPIAPSLLTWYRKLGLNILEGYAMTEDFCYSHLGQGSHTTPGFVGVPCPGVEVRIDSSGEILIKSPGRLAGYYKRPDLDADSVTADGFFRTGDVGERNADGELKITGRLKDAFKTAKGKFVAPAPIERHLNAHPLIEQSIVAGFGQPAPFAVVVLSDAVRPRLGESAVMAQVEDELRRLHTTVNAQLATYERLHMLVVASEPWSIENGCLTPTLKIKRSRIEAALASRVDGWYRQPGPVLWA